MYHSYVDLHYKEKYFSLTFTSYIDHNNVREEFCWLSLRLREYAQKIALVNVSMKRQNSSFMSFLTFNIIDVSIQDTNFFLATDVFRYIHKRYNRTPTCAQKCNEKRHNFLLLTIIMTTLRREKMIAKYFNLEWNATMECFIYWKFSLLAAYRKWIFIVT